ncbi:Nicotinate-nucleotide adenylyltransferase [Anatilimnocola aggregata]|uniref:Probable nicotinate-nucleotide adenylyltransferase n=1 Tax=Anatilimnocola aggregata TaxID=2528021 RepID=A0A517YCM0_9BACT|nr:nicotinate-nucleotide adenylyltransferase [Anatilimnocola aggregata]QDU27987.1 Nicotinate-nucleotide adenylyltransferase [Anatilimnocola aggregata]
MKIGIFGGSFDPIHYGHLLLADSAREQLALDQVWFIPAAVAPHKQDRHATNARQRIEMLELAIAGNEHFRLSTIEIDRGGVSYTVETLQTIAEQMPGAELFLLMGADSLRDLLTWREPGRICELAAPVVSRRAGAPDPDFTSLAHLLSPARLLQLSALRLEMPIVELSSTDLRYRARVGQSLRYRTPRAVEEYIRAQQLYR